MKNIVIKIHNSIIANIDLIKFFFIPVAFFALDFILRLVIGLDITDIGSDMVAISISIFLSLLVDDRVYSNTKNIIALLFYILIFLFLWIVSFKILTFSAWIIKGFAFDFRVLLTYTIGFISILFSKIITQLVI